jgi:hypothetical protein
MWSVSRVKAKAGMLCDARDARRASAPTQGRGNRAGTCITTRKCW